MAGEEHLTLEILIAILVLVLYTVAAPIFEKYHFHYIHESGLVMLLGIVITLLIKLISPSADFTKSLGFDDELFFTFILPLIIFGAGYNLKRRSFFKYFMYIFLLGVVGTLIAFGVVAPVTYLFNSFKIFYLSFSQYDYETLLKMNGETPETIASIMQNITAQINGSTVNGTNTTSNVEYPPILLDFSLQDIFLFAAVISATDAVAALTFIHEDSEPKLFAILFGEGVVNDAVCIVIYSIVRDFSLSGKPFNASAAMGMVGTFLNLFISSFILGLVVGIIGSLFLKKLKVYNIGRVAESALIILFAYLSYILTESLHLSPIIALLFNGIFNSHYSFYNLSFQAREESSILSRVLSGLAEAFIFTYLGLTAIHYFSIAFSWSFMIFELITVVCGRFISVFGICFLMEHVLKIKSFRLSMSEKGIMGCSGTIRGAIAFGLSISIQSNKQLNRDILLSTTLSLVFISTVVFGALMPYVIKFFKNFSDSQSSHEMNELDENNEDVNFKFLHPNYDNDNPEFSKEKNLQKLKKRLSYWIGTYWIEFDDEYVKPKLINNWPDVKKEHDEIASVIQGVIKDYLEEKKKKKMANLPINSSLEHNEGINNNNVHYGNIKNENDEHYDPKYEADFMQLQDSEHNTPTLQKLSREEILNKY